MKLNYTKIFETFTNKNRQSFFVILGIVGVILIALSNTELTDSVDKHSGDTTVQQYKLQLEKEITALLKEINGVGDVKVMISLESGEENIYVEQHKSSEDVQTNKNGTTVNESKNNSFENEIVIVSQQNNNTPLVEKVVLPQVQGVAVVCSGADDITVVSAVTNSVSVVLNVPTNRIFVTKMK